MFVIKKRQYAPFKLPIRKKKREQMLLQLQTKGYKADEGDNRDLIITDSKGNKTRLLFDENYIAQKIIKPSGLEYGFTFDEDDNLAKLSFPGNEFIGLSYQKNLLRSIVLNQSRIGINYDEKYRIVEIISPDNQSHKLTYNISAQLDTITNRANEARKYETAIKGNRLIYTLKDSLGRATKIDTDPLGSGDTIIFPDGTKETTVYDEDYDAYVTTLRNGTKKIIHYEGINPARVEWEDGNYLNLEINDKQQVEALENPAGTIRYEYDEQERIIAEEFQGNEVKYVYDDDGLLTEMIYPSGLVVKYNYDEDGRLKEVNADGNICSYNYAENDTISEIIYPNGFREERKQQILGGLTENTLSNRNGQIIARQHYQYDNLSRLTSYRSTDSSRSQRDKHWQLSYDAEDRLLSNVEINKNTSEHFEYDHKGNFSAINGSKVKIGVMDEIQSIAGKEIEYDRNGNVKSFIDKNGKSIKLTFSNDGLLASAKRDSIVTYFWYDALGRRIAKSDGKTSSLFYWAGETLFGEKYTLNGVLVFREYIYDPNDVVPIGFRENNNFYCLHKDVRGAVIDVSDVNGHIKWSASYDSFGGYDVYINELYQPWRLMGQYCDEETGFNYSIGRYYAPHLKSYLSLDPLWYIPRATNYSYCYNDPYNKADTSGRIWHVVAAAAVGAVVGGILGAVEEGSWEGAIKGAAKGALTGVGAALGGFGGLALASAAATFAVSVYEQMKGKADVCIPCVLKNAALDATQDAALTLLTAGLSRFAAVKVLAKLGGKVKVTTWAAAGTKPDFNSGRQVIMGSKTRFNQLSTGTVVSHKSRTGEMVKAYPFKDGKSEWIPASSLKPIEGEPKVLAHIKMIFLGQYQIK